MEINKINLGKISDKQQLLLTKLSYLDFDMEEYEKMKLSGQKITISDLEGLLSNPGNSYLGLTYLKTSEFKREGLNIPTQREIIEQLRESGLGDVAIVDIGRGSEINFKAIAFDDDFNNRGFSYSGTDFTKISQDKDDNLPLYLEEKPELIEAAKTFFNKNQKEILLNEKDGDYFLYGHAVGGNMAMHTYIENYKKIKRIFTINSTNIERAPNTIDSPDMQCALSNGEKNFRYFTGGAYVGTFEGELDPYEFNVRYIPSRRHIDSLLGNLIPDGIMFIDNMDLDQYEENIYNINDNFIEISKQQANEGCKEVPKRKKIENQEPNKTKKEGLRIKEVINKAGEFSKNIVEKTKTFFKNIFGKKEDMLTDGTNPGSDSAKEFKEKYKCDTSNNSVPNTEQDITNEQQKTTSGRSDNEIYDD